MSAGTEVRTDLDEHTMDDLRPQCDCADYFSFGLPGFLKVQRCRQPAVWALVLGFNCGHSLTTLVCERHRDLMVAGDVPITHGDHGAEPFTIQSSERL